MNRNLTMLSAVILVLPIAVETPHDTSGHVTRISVGGGVGDYATILRGCDGNVIDAVPITLREVGADVEQQVVGPLRVGIRGGTAREEIDPPDLPSYVRTRRYVNPYFSLEGRSLGLGAGPIFSNESQPNDGQLRQHEPRFSGHLRFGGRRKYFSTSLMENVPLASGGGHFDLGVGFAPGARSDWWVGLSGGPFDGPGATVKSAWRVSPRWTIDASGRLGYSGGENQSGIGVGITSRFGQLSGQPRP